MPPREGFAFNKERMYVSLSLIALNVITPLFQGLSKGFNTALVIWCVIAIIFFLWFFVRVGYPTITGRHAIELTSAGIENNITGKTIRWNEVERLTIHPGNGSHILVINLATLDNHKPRNFMLSIVYNLSIKKYGSPIIINTKTLNVTASFLLTQMLIFKEKYDKLKA
jgi:hypothetical protein